MATDHIQARVTRRDPSDQDNRPQGTAEREVKLGAEESFQLPDLTATRDGVAATARPDEQLSTVYLDSDDLRLARWDVSLRYREGQGWTVKLPRGSSGPLLVRDEMVFEGSPERPPPDAVDLIGAYLRGASLRPQLRVNTLRRGVRLRDRRGRLLADVVDDAVAVVDGPGPAVRFRELEVEVTTDTPPGLLEAVVAQLRAAGAGAPDPTPKYLHALGGRDAAPPEISLLLPSTSSSLGEVIAYAIADGVTRLIRHDPVVRMDTDPEGVHQARVATRRLRSDLRTLRTALDPHWSRELRDELGWLGGALGAARDADVLLARLASRAQSLPIASAEGAREVIGGLEERRAQAHAQLLEQLRGDRYFRLVDRLIDAAHAPAVREGQAGLAARKALKPLVRGNWRALERMVESLSDPPRDEELHTVRILAKRCRYAAELAAPVLGRRTREFAAAAGGLQDRLGELHDGVVAEQWLREWAKHGPSAVGAFAAGELAALERHAADRARAGWPHAWKRVEAAAPA